MLLLVIVLSSGSVVLWGQTGVRKPLRRQDSFFGLHFDFHATEADEHIGRTLSYGMIDTLLSEVHPDFIQVDCKGHPGITSYPTKVGNPATSFDKDPLRLWREVTRKHGVALYVHYSGVFDKKAIRTHPEWAAVNWENKIDSNNTSVHGGYVDGLLIPQFKELSKEYGIDGVWVDGDCWATVPDYSTASLEAFRKETGLTTVPHSSKDSGFAQFMDFTRRSFLNYVQRYTSELHRFNPDFQVASNWAFSSFIPRPVSVDVDFLSGDLTPVNSLNNAAFEGRCLASQAQSAAKPWDIMSWSFTLDWDKNVQTKKSAVQLEQEAAEIISMGGGFQSYFTQNRDASIRPWEVSTMKELGQFVNARRGFCKGALPVPQIALLYSGAAHERNEGFVFSNGGLDRIRGIMTALLDGQQAVEIKMEHHLHGHMAQYPLIVVPEWSWLPEDFRQELLQYASDGGKLLVIGAKATRLFAKEGGITILGSGTDEEELSNNELQYLGYQGDLSNIRGRHLSIGLLPGTRAFGSLQDVQDFRFGSKPAASIAVYGKGKIACVAADMGISYEQFGSYQERAFLNALTASLFEDPIVQVSGSHLVHVAVDSLGSKKVIHLINTAGPHAAQRIFSYDEIPVIGPLTVSIRMKKPHSLVLQPENKPLAYTYADGRVTVKIPGLKIHSMIVAE